MIAAKRLGAEQIVLLGSNPDRTALGEQLGATDIVRERGDEAVERVRDLTGGLGAHSVLECVGHDLSMTTALAIARPGGAVGRVGVPQHEQVPTTRKTFFDNVAIPRAHLIGPEHEGWKVATTTLAHERGTAFPFKEQVLHKIYVVRPVAGMTSMGTPGSCFDARMTREVLTLATFGAAVSSWMMKS